MPATVSKRSLAPVTRASALATAEPERQRQLMAAVAAGHGTAAYVELFRFYLPRLESFLKKLGAGAQEAEELAQETMLIVWRKAAAYDPAKSSVGTWIFTIARHLRIDAVRRERARAFDPAEPLLLPEALPLPDAQVQSVEHVHRVRAALELLPRKQAEVVGLAFYGGRSHAEIAESLAIPLGTVKSRMRLAFQHIRETLDARAA